MEPKDKATELVKRFWMKNKSGQDSYIIAVGNAIIAVEEILEIVVELSPQWCYYHQVLTELKSM
jgi:hypothetical protein